MKISSKLSAETIPVTFDYSTITTRIDSIVQTGISAIAGTDANVATMLIGTPIIVNDSSVVQLVRNGVVGVTYRLFCLVAIGGEKYQIDGDMAVKAWHTK